MKYIELILDSLSSKAALQTALEDACGASWGFRLDSQCCQGPITHPNRKEGSFMIEKVRVNNISQINKIVHAASSLNSDVGIHDANGQIADAKSLLGLLRLDYSRPVEVVSENARALRACVRACMA